MHSSDGDVRKLDCAFMFLLLPVSTKTCFLSATFSQACPLLSVNPMSIIVMRIDLRESKRMTFSPLSWLDVLPKAANLFAIVTLMLLYGFCVARMIWMLLRCLRNQRRVVSVISASATTTLGTFWIARVSTSNTSSRIVSL